MIAASSRRSRHQADVDGSPAPHAPATVAGEDRRHPCSPVKATRSLVGHDTSSYSLTGGTLSPVPGRFAPSPTARLHVGNLRTALIAWLFSRSAGDTFRLRMEDLDRVTASRAHEVAQRDDLAAIGIDWDGEVWRQSERFRLHDAAIARLEAAGATYECYCSRREMREAVAAPHDAARAVYPGTCRELSEPERRRRRDERSPAIRFRASSSPVAVDDLVAGPVVGVPWDVVLRRNDGVPAYNLAVVVDDAAAGIDVVVRGDDLLVATPSQLAIGRALGLPPPRHAHVPLVVGADGQRLAKRDGAVTLPELAATGLDAADVRSFLAVSLGIADVGETVEPGDLVERFDVGSFVRRSHHPIALTDLLPGVSRHPSATGPPSRRDTLR